MNEQPPQPQKSKLPKILALVIGVIFFIIAFAVVSKIARHGVKALLNAAGGAPKFAESAWAPRKVEDVEINTPFGFGPGPDISTQLPEQVRNAITHMQIFQSTGTPKSFVTMISRIEYKPGIKTSIDGAVQGAMRNMGAAIGDPDPKYSAAPASVSGLEGRKVSYHGQKSGQAVHVESVFANQGQKLWQIQVLYQHAESAADVARIIQSLKISPAP